METEINKLKVDQTKLITVQNYAKDKEISRPTVYKKIREKELKTIRINGVLFIDLG